MRKPPMAVIMFGHGEPSHDEDGLDREQDRPDDVPDTLQLLHDRLRAGDETASHAAMMLSKCLAQMCHYAARKDKAGLQHWFKQARDVICHIDGDREDEEEDDNG
jgi:hypothetical protein